MFSDPLFLWISGANIAMMLLVVLFVLLRVRPDEFVVVIRFSSEEGLAQGNWLSNYNILTYALMLGFGNTLLAAQAFKKHRLVSFVLLLGAVLGQILALIVINLIISGNSL